MFQMRLARALVAVVSVAAVRYESTSRADQARCTRIVSLRVSGRTDENETMNEISWLETEHVNSFGGYSLFQQLTADGKRLQYYLGCDWLKGRPTLYFEEVAEDGQRVPDTFAVLRIPHTEPLQIFVGRGAEEKAEFAWKTLILDVLVEGTISIYDDDGFASFGPARPPKEPPTTTSAPRLEPAKPSAWQTVRKLRQKLLAAPESPESTELTEDGESSSTAEEDVVDIHTGVAGEAQRALPPDPPSEETEAQASRSANHFHHLKFCLRPITLEVVGTMNWHGSQKSIHRPAHTKVKVPANGYTKLGGKRIYLKQAPGKKDKLYYLRCDYQTGEPFLLVRQGGDVEVRPFNIIKWWRKTSVSESLGESLTLLADPVSIPFPVVRGYVTVTPS